jgi:hypothetical protein
MASVVRFSLGNTVKRPEGDEAARRGQFAKIWKTGHATKTPKIIEGHL